MDVLQIPGTHVALLISILIQNKIIACDCVLGQPDLLLSRTYLEKSELMQNISKTQSISRLCRVFSTFQAGPLKICVLVLVFLCYKSIHYSLQRRPGEKSYSDLSAKRAKKQHRYSFLLENANHVSLSALIKIGG